MIMNATITLNQTQMREIICNYLERQGINNVSHQDISFVIEAVEHGDQRDTWTTHELTQIQIKNIRIGTGEHIK